MTDFFVAVGDERRGPYSVAQLTARVVLLAPTTLVWRRGMAEWAAASTVPDLGPALGADTEPPPFRQAKTEDTRSVNESTIIPQWMIMYAVAVTPMLWLVQRGCNINLLLSESKNPSIAEMVFGLAFWAAMTLCVNAVVVLGGIRAADHPEQRSRLLRVGIGGNVLLGAAAIVYGLIAMVAVVAPQGDAQPPSDVEAGGTAVLVGAALCLLQVVADTVVWIKLGRVGNRS